MSIFYYIIEVFSNIRGRGYLTARGFTMAGRNLGEESIKILDSLMQGGGMVFDEFLKAGHAYDQRIYRAYAKSFYNLERGGYVKVKKDKKNQSFFHLTPKGRLSVLKYLHLEKITKKWDKHWRIIIFDIPENRKKLRDRVRTKLKDLGFKSLQESVYITPYPVLKDLDIFLEERRLRNYFRYVTVAEIDGEEVLKEEFNLS